MLLPGAARHDNAAQFRDAVIILVNPHIHFVVVNFLQSAFGFGDVCELTPALVFFLLAFHVGTVGRWQAINHVAVITHCYQVSAAQAFVQAHQQGVIQINRVRVDQELLKRHGRQPDLAHRLGPLDLHVMHRHLHCHRLARHRVHLLNILNPWRMFQHLNVIRRDKLRKRHVIKAGVMRHLDHLPLIVPPADDTVAEQQGVVHCILDGFAAIAFRQNHVVHVVRGLFGLLFVALAHGLELDHLVIAEDGANDRRQNFLDRSPDVARHNLRPAFLIGQVSHRAVVILHGADAVGSTLTPIAFAFGDQVSDDAGVSALIHRHAYTTFRVVKFQLVLPFGTSAKRFIISAYREAEIVSSRSFTTLPSFR